MPGSDFKAQIQGARRNPFSLLLQWETKGTEQTGYAEAAQSMASARRWPARRETGLGRTALELGPWHAQLIMSQREREVRSKTRGADPQIPLTASLENGSLGIVMLLQGLGSYRVPAYWKILTWTIHLAEAVSISRNCGVGEKRNSGIYKQVRTGVGYNCGGKYIVTAPYLGPGDSVCLCPYFCLFYPRL